MTQHPRSSRPAAPRHGRSLALGGVLTLVAALTVAVPETARAADPQLLGAFGDWTAYTFKEGDGQVCYMASQPKRAEGDYTQRGDIFALVTHRPAEKALNVFSVVAGYPYKDGSEVTLTIDRKSFSLFTQGDRAWARTAKLDAEIAEALRKGTTLVIKGTSQRGTSTSDSYSLRGSGAAFDTMSKACGVTVE